MTAGSACLRSANSPDRIGHDPAKWAEFRRRYKAELAHNPSLEELRALMRRDGRMIKVTKNAMNRLPLPRAPGHSTHRCSRAKARGDRAVAGPRSALGAAACFVLNPCLGPLCRWSDENGLGCGDAVRPNITLERRAGREVRIGLRPFRPFPRECGDFGVIVSSDGLDEEGRRLGRPQPRWRSR